MASSLVTFSFGLTAAVFVAGSASAASPTTTKSATSTTPKSPTTTTSTTSTTPKSPAAHFFVINGTVNAASVHVIAGSSAFPNFATGAFDNYYSLAHSHVDNSPSAEGRASPFDTGPIGQTAAAGHFQQPQYADARWPGDSGKATYGKQGEPYAAAEASEYKATAEASLASHRFSGPPSGSSPMAVPKGFDDRLRLELAEWEAKWQGLLSPKKPADTVTTPKAPTVTTPKAPTVTTPKTHTVATPKAPTVTTPVATLGDLKSAPPAPAPAPESSPAVPSPAVPPPAVPSAGTAAPSRSLTSASPSASPSPDVASLLESSTLATLDAKANTLVTSGESTLGRVSLGGGQIVIKGINVSASIANDGSPTYEAAVSVAAASIGGVPVRIDQDGVHVAGQRQGVPYQQASDALNGALKQAGIQLFLVAPEVTTNSCAPPGAGTGSGSGTGTTTTTTTTTSSSDQAGTTSSCDQTGMTAGCEQTGTGGGTGTGTGIGTTTTTTTTTTSSSDQSGTTSSCDQTGMTATCEQTGTGTGTGTTTTTTTNTTSSNQSATTTTPSWCVGMGTTPSTPTSMCAPPGRGTGTTTTSNSSTGTTTTTTSTYPAGTTTTGTTSSSDQMGSDTGTTSSGQLTVRATGLHVVFTQPVNQSGVPAQSVEYILGEVFADSLAVPAGPLPDLGFSSSAASSSSSSSASCGGGGGDSAQTGASGGASTGGSAGSLSPSASGFGSGSQPNSGSSSGLGSSSNGESLPAAFAEALRKPLWLLLAYLLWQAVVIGTGVSLWNWRRGDAT